MPITAIQEALGQGHEGRGRHAPQAEAVAVGGKAAPLAREMPAAELVASIITDARRVLAALAE